jgi:phospholipase/carboxylesterase
MTNAPTSFIHRFVPATTAGRPPLLLLHGTGGDENDLLPLGEAIAPGSALLSPRGKVSERGMPRFFRRLSEGVIDEEDVRLRAGELAAFISEARAAYGLEAPIALGLSNGANIAAALLLLHPGALAGAVLLRPMPVLSEPPRADLTGTPVLMLSGTSDPLVTAEQAKRLAETLSASGATVEHRVLPAGHNLSQADFTLSQAWLVQR